jgi:hypothetical protein
MSLAGNLRFLWSGARRMIAGPRTVVICPTAELPAHVGLDPAQPIIACSRWPELEGCSQACMPQIQFSAEELQDFIVRHEGKPCTSCGAVITGDDWYRSRLAPAAEAGGPDKPASPRLLPSEGNDPICSACHRAKM